MVYRGGLENRYLLTGIGGSNPSPSAREAMDRVVASGLASERFGLVGLGPRLDGNAVSTVQVEDFA